MGEIRTVAIVGGGLAGLATAHALATVGIEAEVFERASTFAEIGAGINISAQAVKALRAIGLGTKLEFRDPKIALERYGAPNYTFHRADLMNALASGLDPKRLHLKHRLTAVE